MSGLSLEELLALDWADSSQTPVVLRVRWEVD